MPDPRYRKLAEILVFYSTAVKPGEWVHIEGHQMAEPLVNEVFDCVLEAGGNPTYQLYSDTISELLLKKASDEQLKFISPLYRKFNDEVDVSIFIEATENTRSLNGIDPSRQRIRQVASQPLMESFLKRAAEGDVRWVLSGFPCQAYAQDADLSLREYEDFLFSATFADQEDPVAHWQRMHDNQQRLVEWLKGRKIVSVKSPNADLTLSIEGRTFINSDGKANMPCGEIFTGPVEDSANGWVKFTYPGITGGREISGVYLEFEAGKVVKASAEKNETYLLEMLDSDEGARYLGEFAIGTNYGIQHFTKNILFDEKLGGTFHLALGASYPETGGTNQSSIHWDLIADLKHDSEIRVDGTLFYRDGQFQV